jgi:hypothetical protein
MFVMDPLFFPRCEGRTMKMDKSMKTKQHSKGGKERRARCEKNDRIWQKNKTRFAE